MDRERFDEAWDRHSASILRYCSFSTGSRHDGDDLTAETFARLVQHGDGIAPEKLEAWLFTVARNLCASHFRSRSRTRGLLARLAASGPPEESVQPHDSWLDPEVWSHVRPLDEKSRLTIYLHVVEDRTFAEIASITGSSVSGAKRTYSRAIESIRKSMGDRGIAPVLSGPVRTRATPVGAEAAPAEGGGDGAQ